MPESLKAQAPFGIYNVVNTGAVTTGQIVAMIQRFLKPARNFEFESNGADHAGNGTSVFHNILDNTKLLGAGEKMRKVEDALEDALRHWQPAPPAGDVDRSLIGLAPGRAKSVL